MSKSGWKAKPMASVSRDLKAVLPRRLSIWAGLGAIVLALNSLSAFARDHALMINISPSLPYWAIWLDRTATPKRGDIILFDPPPSQLLEKHFGKEPKPFGKHVMGVAGDRVTKNKRIFYVNGKPVATAKTHSKRGEPLELGPTGVIPPGCVFVATSHKDGFDSRYASIGWICRPRIFGVGRPIL
jgi:conjugal transfer pilin signal peptidase TrbI